MSVVNVQFFSQSLNQHVHYNVILPREGAGPYPVLLQLHGLTDDYTAWVYKSNLVEHASGYPMLIVMPDGGTSGYLNIVDTERQLEVDDRLGVARYEDAIARDLREHVSRVFNVRSGPWAIGGLSMGGFGSLRLGMKYPDLFNSIWAHSSAPRIGWLMADRTPDLADAQILTHARQLAAAGTWPEISFDCGTEDDLIGENRQLHGQLDELGIPHHYAEHPGGHTWAYWDLHVRSALEQHARVFGLST